MKVEANKVIVNKVIGKTETESAGAGKGEQNEKRRVSQSCTVAEKSRVHFAERHKATLEIIKD